MVACQVNYRILSIMEHKSKLEKIVQQIVDKLPADADNIYKETSENLKSAIQSSFTDLGFVSRKEFDIQAELLARTRSLVTELEQKIATLEGKK